VSVCEGKGIPLGIAPVGANLNDFKLVRQERPCEWPNHAVRMLRFERVRWLIRVRRFGDIGAVCADLVVCGCP
jgi:hypothetical protein